MGSFGAAFGFFAGFTSFFAALSMSFISCWVALATLKKKGGELPHPPPVLGFAVSQDARGLLVFGNETSLKQKHLFGAVAGFRQIDDGPISQNIQREIVHVEEENPLGRAEVAAGYDLECSEIATSCSAKFVKLDPLSLLHVAVQFRPYLHPFPGSGASAHLGLLPFGMVVTRSPVTGLRSGLSW